MIVGSLFSGCGAFDLGLERAGHTVAWQVECDPAAVAVLQRHWPSTVRYGDIRSVDWTTVAPVDALVGGPPCQPISSAGKRLGPDDERWMWNEVWRAVDGLRPRIVVMENPPGIAKWLPELTAALASRGYVGSVRRVCSAHLGAPHRRERVLLLAHSDCDRLGGLRHASESGCGPLHRPLFDVRRGAASAGAPAPAPPDADGAGHRGVAAERRPGPAVSPDGTGGSVAEPTSKRSPGSPPDSGHADTEIRRQGRWCRFAEHPELARYAPAVQRWERLHGAAPDPLVWLRNGWRENPEWAGWMMGLPAGWVEGPSWSAQLRLIGNAVQVQVTELVGGWLSHANHMIPVAKGCEVAG